MLTQDEKSVSYIIDVVQGTSQHVLSYNRQEFSKNRYNILVHLR